MSSKKYYIVKNAVISGNILAFTGQVVFLSKGLVTEKPGESKLQHFLRVIGHYRNLHLPSNKVFLELEGKKHELHLDGTGAFHIELPYTKTVPPAFQFFYSGDSTTEPQICEELFDEKVHNYSGMKFGVISDLDDTVMVSKVLRWYKQVWLVISRHPFRRKPVTSVKKTFDFLRKVGGNFFYVSKGEYNLFFLYRNFLRHFNFPEGPLYLSPRLRKRHVFTLNFNAKKTHKMRVIHRILSNFTEKKFVLVGDSGEQDANIYTRLAKEFSEQVIAVVIRDIKHTSNHPLLERSRESLKKLNIPFIMLDDHQPETTLTEVINNYLETSRSTSI